MRQNHYEYIDLIETRDGHRWVGWGLGYEFIQHVVKHSVGKNHLCHAFGIVRDVRVEEDFY